MHAILLALSLLLLAPAASGQPAAQAPAPGTQIVWEIDTGHSELSFRIRHLVSRVRGTFRQWEGTLTGSPADWSTGSVAVRIDASSIDTNNDRRDNHLRADDFFAVAEHPTITFESSRFEVDRDRIRIDGDLTIRGVTQPVVLEGTYLGSITDLQGRRRAAFEAEATVNRQEFGIIWNRAAETGGLLLGDDVTITISVQAVAS